MYVNVVQLIRVHVQGVCEWMVSERVSERRHEANTRRRNPTSNIAKGNACQAKENEREDKQRSTSFIHPSFPLSYYRLLRRLDVAPSDSLFVFIIIS